MRDALIVALRALLLLAFTLLALEMALQLAFPLLPKPVIDRMPQYLERMGYRLATDHGAREYPAGERVDYLITPHSGDLFRHSCLSRADAEAFEPYRVSFTRDAHGFRNAEPWPDDLDLVVLGDSFTAAEHIQRPYWQDLAEAMLVLAAPGIGTLEQQLLFNAYALPRKPGAVVLAFFGGNDLSDNEVMARALEEGASLRDRHYQDKILLDFSVVFRLLQFLSEATTPAGEGDCHYPVIAKTQAPAPVAFFHRFLPLLAMGEEELMKSEKLRVTKASVQEMALAASAHDGQLILMYIPAKAELYWRYLDAADKAKIIEVESRSLGHGGLANIDVNLSVQRDVMRELATEIGIPFLDLTPPLAEAVRAGETPYFFADTHWNQLGHNIARNALLDFLNQSTLQR